MTGVRFASNVEVLFRVLWELFEEECEKGVDILAGSNGGGDGASAVRESNVDWLIKENYRSVGVPRIGVVDNFDMLVDT